MLIENFRPGSLADLGFGYETMATLNPRLIYCSISGYGQSGPHAQLPGYDAVIQGEAGIMDMTGFSDGDPTRVGRSPSPTIWQVCMRARGFCWR